MIKKFEKLYTKIITKNTQILNLREELKNTKKELQYCSSFKRVQTHNLQPRSMNLTNAAKDIGVPLHDFLRALRREGFLYYHRDSTNYPKESWVKCGFFERRGGQTFITEVGREFFKREIRAKRLRIYY